MSGEKILSVLLRHPARRAGGPGLSEGWRHRGERDGLKRRATSCNEAGVCTNVAAPIMTLCRVRPGDVCELAGVLRT